MAIELSGGKEEGEEGLTLEEGSSYGKGGGERCDIPERAETNDWKGEMGKKYNC